MDDPQIDKEEQRARMQDMLRRARTAVLIVMEDNGNLIAAYMNATLVERRGMIELLNDTAPGWPEEFPDGD